MLGAFRRHAYSWGTRFVLGILIAAFVIFFGGFGSYFLQVKPVASIGCGGYFGLFTGSGCRNVLPEELDHEASNLRRMIENRSGSQAADILNNLNLRELALERIIDQAVVEREAKRLGFVVSDDDLARAISSQTAFQVDGRFDQARYDEVLRDNGLEPAEFETDTRAQMLSDLLRHTVTASVQVSDGEAHAQFNRFGEKINLAYIEFPWSNFTAGTPGEADIAKYYQDHREAFREPERVKIDFIRYDPQVLAPKEPPSDADIKQYYEQNLKTLFSHPEEVHARHILLQMPPDATAAEKKAVQAKAEELLQKVRSGAPFAELAKENSDDPGTKDNGGDLGYVSKGELVKPFEDVAFKLKPGEAAIAETQFGIHVIQVLDVKGAKMDSIEEAEPKIIAALKLKQGETIARQDLDQDLAAADVGRSFTDIASKHGLASVETPYLAQDEVIKGAEDYPKLLKQAFAMNTGDIRSFSDGPAPYLVKLIDRKPAHIPPLSEIKDRVAQALIRSRAEAQASNAASKVLKQINSPADFDSVAISNHLQVKTSGEFVRARGEVPGIGLFPEVSQAAGALTAFPGVIPQVLENDGNAFVVNVISRYPPSDAEWKASQRQFETAMADRKQQEAWENFVNDLKRRSRIVVHTDQLGAVQSSNS
jgi:peptidyl-prolyl cis-trans isomerase D